MSKEIIFFCCKFTVFRHFNVGCVYPLFRCLCFFKLNKTEELTFFLDSKDDSCRCFIDIESSELGLI